MITIRTQISPNERWVIPFDFTHGLDDGETIESISSVTIAVAAGSDATASSRLNPAAEIGAGAKRVLVPVKDMVDGASYDITCVAQMSNPNKRLSITARLVCKAGA